MEDSEETHSLKSLSSRSSSPSVTLSDTKTSALTTRKLSRSVSPPTTSSDCSVKKYPVRVGIQWRIGAQLEAKDFQGQWYPARIVEINSKENSVLVHFDGWNARYDEYISMSSEDLRPLKRHSERKEVKVKTVTKPEHKVGDCVFAKWTDCRMYPGRITSAHANGSYEILFYDGFKKSVSSINVKTMPSDVEEEYGKAGLLPEVGKKTKFPIKDIAKELEKKKQSKTEEKDNGETDKTSNPDNSTEGQQEASSEKKPSNKKKRRVQSESQSDSPSMKKTRKNSMSSINLPGDTLTTELPKEQFKCPQPECVKTFRKRNLLESHIKFYHPESMPDLLPEEEPCKRRKSSISKASTSEESEGSYKRVLRKRSEVLSKDVCLVDDNASEGDTKTTSTEEYQVDDEEEGIDHMEKDEVVNCICQINEENGLMIQCDVCLCWQHAACMEICEDTLPQKYICYVCSNPPGIRESCRFMYEQDWLKQGSLPQLSSLLNQSSDPPSVPQADSSQVAHGLVADVLNIERALRATLRQISRVQKPNPMRPPEMMQVALKRIGLLHTDIASSLDQIEEQLTVLESSEEALSAEEIAKDIPRTKKSLYGLTKDMVKVKKLLNHIPSAVSPSTE